MAIIFIPSLLRDLTGGITETNVPGGTLREVIDALDRTYPGLKERLCDGDHIRPNIRWWSMVCAARKGCVHG